MQLNFIRFNKLVEISYLIIREKHPICLIRVLRCNFNRKTIVVKHIYKFESVKVYKRVE